MKHLIDSSLSSFSSPFATATEPGVQREREREREAWVNVRLIAFSKRGKQCCTVGESKKKPKKKKRRTNYGMYIFFKPPLSFSFDFVFCELTQGESSNGGNVKDFLLIRRSFSRKRFSLVPFLALS